MGLLAGVCAFSPVAHATDMLVRVSGIEGNAGMVRVAVCTPGEYVHRDCHYKATLPARPPDMQLVVRGVAAGRYAVIAHHDRSGDGVVHTNWIGIPIDGVGVSRNVEGRFGAPDFEQVAIDVAGVSIATDIILRREPPP